MTTVDPRPSTTLERILDRLRVRLVEFAASKGMGDRADDVVQETLVVLWRKYSTVDGEIDLIKLAFTICKFKIQEVRGPRGHVAAETIDEGLPIADTRPSVEDDLGAAAERRRLREGIERLGLRCRQLFKLQLQETSVSDIAKIMGAPPATVHVWLHRCRKSLYQELV